MRGGFTSKNMYVHNYMQKHEYRIYLPTYTLTYSLAYLLTYHAYMHADIADAHELHMHEPSTMVNQKLQDALLRIPGLAPIPALSL